MKIVERKIAYLSPASYNPRQLSEKQYEDIKQSLTEFGFVDPVIVNIHKDREDTIVGGHQRCRVWAAMGNTTVPCVEVSLTLEKEKELNIRLNKNTGAFDTELLANYFDDADLLDWGFEEWELGIDAEEPENIDSQATEAVNFTINCNTLEQLNVLQEMFKVDAKQMHFDQFIQAING